MDDWKLPWDGGCRCSRTRVRITAPPLLASACHCRGCQQMSSSAYSLTLTVPADGFSILQGEPVIGGLHGPTRHYFCPHCLTWMFTRPEGMASLVNLRPTILDAHDWFTPFLEVWTREQLPWVTTPAPLSYETQPNLDEYARIIEAYAHEATRPG